MGDVVTLYHMGIMGKAVSVVPSQIVLYDAKTGEIRWYNPSAERALKRLSGGLTMNLHDVLHSEEAEAWLLEGQLVLKSGHVIEYVEHVGYAGEELVSSRTGAWERLEEPLTMRKLVYVQVTPASTRKHLVMRIMLPMDKPLQLAEEYMTEEGSGEATITGQ